MRDDAATARRRRKPASRPAAVRSRLVREAIVRCRALIRERGEASGAAAARDALAAYRALDEAERVRFFDALARDFSPDPDAVLQAAQAYRENPSPQTLARLEEVVEPPRQELFRRLNMAPGGTAALVDMRLQVLLGLEAHPQWRVIDSDLRHLLRSWFNRGFLTLARIDWRTSAIVLEKLIAYEAVHQIQGWDDLRRRLQADRRCFAFFHPQLPDDPLIFIEVALTRGMSAKVQPLLDVNAPVAAPELANCAMFYSITNCQEGLRGISFGNFLIKQVAVELRSEFPRIRRFATLSPIPGFRAWLGSQRERLVAGANGAALRALFERLEAPDWPARDGAAADEPLLVPLAAYYLTRAKRGAEPIDAVARFHLGNGAVLERLNWLGDTSLHGLARSYGLMCNYVYRLGEVERNHELFVNEHRVLASSAVERAADAAAAWFGPATA
ncbi:MAG: malonyl-CoA decarboxylase [Pseudomonadota bacterium]